jgi:hypothetical protein
VTTAKKKRRFTASNPLTRVRHRLVARYCPVDRDLYVELTPRFGSSDLRFVMGILDRDVLNDLEARGYDLATLRFHIDKTDAAKREHEKLAGRAPVGEGL